MSYTPKRPGLVTFVAVVLIILGSLSLLGGVCGGAATVFMALQPEPAAPPAPGDIMAPMAQQQHFMAKEVPAYTATQFGILFLELLFGAGQLIAGIGLLRLSPAARMLALFLTVTKLLYALAHHAYQLIFILPAASKLQQQMMADMQKMAGPNAPPPPPIDIGGLTQAMGMIGVGCTFAVQLTIAIMILIVLNMQTTKDAFAGISPGGLPEDDDRLRSRLKGYDEDEDTDYKGSRKPPKSSGDTGFTEKPE